MTKKKTTKRRATKKKVGRKVINQVHLPASVDDFFDADTGELLNPKHELFAQEWMQSFDRAKAIKAAGYKATGNNVYKQAHKILHREEVSMRVRAILRERVQEMAVTENFIVLKMLDIYEKAMEQKPILDAEGNVAGYEYQDLRVAMQTIEKLGVNLGMFQKKVDDRAPNVIINMNYGAPELPAPTVVEGQSKRLN